MEHETTPKSKGFVRVVDTAWQTLRHAMPVRSDAAVML